MDRDPKDYIRIRGVGRRDGIAQLESERWHERLHVESAPIRGKHQTSAA